MPQPKLQLPDNIDTEVVNGVIKVTNKVNGEFILGYQLKPLANKLVRGESIDRTERVVIGCAMLHLLAIAK